MKYNVCMPIELEFERRRAEIRLLNHNRAIQGLPPVKPSESPQKPAEGSEADFKDDEPIPYHLTPLGVAVVEGGLQVAVIHSTSDFNNYEKWRARMNKRARKTVKKNKKVDNQRKSKQLSIFDEERGDTE